MGRRMHQIVVSDINACCQHGLPGSPVRAVIIDGSGCKIEMNVESVENTEDGGIEISLSNSEGWKFS